MNATVILPRFRTKIPWLPFLLTVVIFAIAAVWFRIHEIYSAAKLPSTEQVRIEELRTRLRRAPEHSFVEYHGEGRMFMVEPPAIKLQNKNNSLPTSVRLRSTQGAVYQIDVTKRFQIDRIERITYPDDAQYEEARDRFEKLSRTR
jgi:hypothetical protein